MDVQRSSAVERPLGREAKSDAGVYIQNREDMTVARMEERHEAGEWKENDLFAVFRDDLGGTHVQYSPMSDFFEPVMTQLVRTREEQFNVTATLEIVQRLVAMLMISRVHPYHFENFVEMRDHENRQLFDMRGLCSWIATNQELFITPSDIAAEALAAEDLEDLRNGDEESMERLMGEAA